MLGKSARKEILVSFLGPFCEIAAHLVNPGYLGAVHEADDINLFPFVGKRPICQLPQSLLSKNPSID